MAKRVFELARELGVTSKAVLQKCRAEGLDVKNHMTALSAGLSATIMDWFSDETSGTAVELTEHVDLDAEHKKAEAQKRRRKKAEAVEEAAAPAEAGEAPAEAVAVAEAPAEAPVVEAPVAEEAPGEVTEAAPVVGAPAEVSVIEAPVVEVEAAVAETVEPEAVPVAEVEAPVPEAEAPAEPEAPAETKAPGRAEAPKVVPNEPTRPEVIGPAGPQVVPTPAKMQGPRVVRFDGVEPEVVAPRRRSTFSSRPPMIGGGEPDTGDGAIGGKGPPGAGDRGKKGAAKRRSPRRKSGRAAEPGEGIRAWRDRDLAERSQRLAAATGGTLRRHRASVGQSKVKSGPNLVAGKVEVEEPITIRSLSAATGIRINEMIRKLMAQGVLATINSTLDTEQAEALAMDHGIELSIKAAVTAESMLTEVLAKRESGDRIPRAPIVTFLGHVDHGKTSLLDRIRSETVADGEDGGITQHIGSYRYDVGDQHVVFLDTPGHEAFTAMRARGANMTDVVVLVVAADDGVMPQTIEAINHAKAAGVPIVVALNKIDLPNANIQRALGQLAEYELHPREWGGEIEVIQTSAATGDGVDRLIETLSLEAELLELKADPEAPAEGYVIEARRNPSRGVIATLLVRDGTLSVGDLVLCGRAYGKIRAMTDDRGNAIKQAGPATPVEITGLDDVPLAGDRFHVVDSLDIAKGVAEDRRQRERTEALSAAPTRSLENIFERIVAGQSSELRLIVKADVQGSLEALLGSLAKQQNEEVRATVLHSGVGGITEGDVLLAEASDAIILGFGVVPDNRARVLAESKGVDIRTYRVIYQLLEDVQKAVTGMLAKEYAEEITGRAEVREIYKISRLGTIAGCNVQDGVITRNSKVRIIRDSVVIEEGRELDSLKRFKDDVREVRAGFECGLKLVGYDDIKVGDVIEAYRTVEVART